jgi:hypothetical protein
MSQLSQPHIENSNEALDNDDDDIEIAAELGVRVRVRIRVGMRVSKGTKYWKKEKS